jgi:hypothetical protein
MSNPMMNLFLVQSIDELSPDVQHSDRPSTDGDPRPSNDI